MHCSIKLIPTHFLWFHSIHQLNHVRLFGFLCKWGLFRCVIATLFTTIVVGNTGMILLLIGGVYTWLSILGIRTFILGKNFCKHNLIHHVKCGKFMPFLYEFRGILGGFEVWTKVISIPLKFGLTHHSLIMIKKELYKYWGSKAEQLLSLVTHV